MRKPCSAMAVIGVLVACNAFGAPVGPGGRIYFTYEQSGSQTDNQLQLYRIDVDSNWDNLTGATHIASVRNAPAIAGGNYWMKPVSPEILHPRANPDGTRTGGDGSVFMAGYYDNSLHTRFTKVMPDGATSLMHPGIGDSTYDTRGEKHTQNQTNFAVDVAGDFAGKAGGICGLASPYGDGVWHDVNANDDLTDDCDAFYRVGYSVGVDADAEIGGSPGDSSVENTHWSQDYAIIKRCTYTGDGNDTHNWASGVSFYYMASWLEETGRRFRLAYNHGSLAVGDTDNNGKTDVYAVYTTWYGQTAGAGIVRMEDGDGSGKIDNEVDLCQVIYNHDTLATGNTTFRNDLNADSDIELIKDPTTGKWTLLILDAGSSWDGVDGQVMAMELSDNGDFVGTADALKLIYQGIETGGRAEPAWVVLGMEFDADPLPIPGDSNGDGKIDGGDLAIWQQNYDPLGTGNNTFALGDWNGDGKIDGGDLALWQQNYDPIGPTGADGMGANVPEPATLLLLGTGLTAGIGVLRRRRMK